MRAEKLQSVLNNVTWGKESLKLIVACGPTVKELLAESQKGYGKM